MNSSQQPSSGPPTVPISSEGRLTHEQAMALQHYIMDKALSIVEAKRHDYSGDADPFGNFRKSTLFKVEPWRGVLVRLTDKLSRIENITDTGVRMVEDEDLWQTFADAVNYVCILGGLVAEIIGMPEGLVKKPHVDPPRIGQG